VRTPRHLLQRQLRHVRERALLDFLVACAPADTSNRLYRVKISKSNRKLAVHWSTIGIILSNCARSVRLKWAAQV
jgi:hypothetical protein